MAVTTQLEGLARGLHLGLWVGDLAGGCRRELRPAVAVVKAVQGAAVSMLAFQMMPLESMVRRG